MSKSNSVIDMGKKKSIANRYKRGLMDAAYSLYKKGYSYRQMDKPTGDMQAIYHTNSIIIEGRIAIDLESYPLYAIGINSKRFMFRITFCLWHLIRLQCSSNHECIYLFLLRFSPSFGLILNF